MMQRLRGLIVVDRRAFATLLLLACVLQWSADVARAQVVQPSDPRSQTTLTLLGTAGGPGGLASHAGIASLISVGDNHYLIDAGEGVSRQISRANLREADISTVFLTHLHNDHTAGLPSLMTFAHTGRSAPMVILGPPNTVRLVESALSYLSVNAEIRNAEARGRRQPPEAFFKARDIGVGEAFDDGVVRVTAVENTHFNIAADSAAARNRSYAYRFVTPDRTVVFTGDTGPSDAVQQLARGADILVAEFASATDIASVPESVREHMLKEHLTAAELGKLAAGAGVRTVVISHYREVSPEDVSEIARYFDGVIAIGQDLDRF
jgi:ribonuclease BN (tRNA processing enzyme)